MATLPAPMTHPFELPEIPSAYPTGTDAERAAAAIEVGRLGLVLQRAQMLASAAQNLDHEAAATERHRITQEQATLRHAENMQPVTRKSLAYILSWRTPIEVPAEEIGRAVQERWAMMNGFPEVEPAAPPAPGTAPAPTPGPGLAPGAVVPPAELNDEDAAWYLETLMPEFIEWKWKDLTIEGARRHWREFGRPKGRKWRADAPPPAWGPLWVDRPPGIE